MQLDITFRANFSCYANENKNVCGHVILLYKFELTGLKTGASLRPDRIDFMLSKAIQAKLKMLPVFNNGKGTIKHSASLIAILVLCILFQFVGNVHSMTSFEKDITLKYSEKVTLDRFRERVAHRLTHDYMKQDIWLVRWLRARDFNMDQAEQMLKENLRWRKANRMDTSLAEDWSEFREKYPYNLDTINKQGMPSDWDLRAITIAGRSSQFIRYIDMIMEDAAETVRRFQSQGKNVTQFDFLVNMDNYNVITQGCGQCLQFYIALVNGGENHYPGLADKIVLINSPPIFGLVLQVIRPLMSRTTRESLKVLGQDKTQWTKVLWSIADRSQLRPEYGGTFRRKGE
ncbi:SEC14-like protein 2, partial [Orchesella cincta]